ncbi:MAG: DUF4957 domain-containing protein [Chitinophagaceae bacterium]
MPSRKFLTIPGLILSVAAALFLYSCKKEYKVGDFDPDRMFKPGQVTVTNGETNVLLRWGASLFSAGRGVTYNVEISEDPLFASTPVFTANTDTTALIVTDADLEIKTDYYARIKTNTTGNSNESGWVVSPVIRISGEQIFFPVNSADLTDRKVRLKWRQYPGLTRIVLTPAGGTAMEIPLTADDVTASSRLIEGLTGSTLYTAEIFLGVLSKGLISFTTNEPSIYTTILSPTDNLVDAIAAAANGDLIGLEPGIYNSVDNGGLFTNIVLQQKTITLASISNNPDDTKVNFKEIVFKGSGAGMVLQGIELDGAASTASGQQALYLINLVGAGSDPEAAVFTKLEINNCVIRNLGNCLMRANRAANNDHKIDLIRLNNVRCFNSASINTNYGLFTINKLEFRRMELLNSTFYKSGRAFIDWSATIIVTPVPVVLVDQCTINTLGMQNGNKNIVFDANGSVVNLSFQNSIIANTPYPAETSQPAAIRLGAGSVASFNNNNTFKFTGGGATPAALTFPATVTLLNNQELDLGWTDQTTDFNIPAGSPLRTAGVTGGPIGDPRWIN